MKWDSGIFLNIRIYPIVFLGVSNRYIRFGLKFNLITFKQESNSNNQFLFNDPEILYTESLSIIVTLKLYL